MGLFNTRISIDSAGDYHYYDYYTQNKIKVLFHIKVRKDIFDMKNEVDETYATVHVQWIIVVSTTNDSIIITKSLTGIVSHKTT